MYYILYDVFTPDCTRIHQILVAHELTTNKVGTIRRCQFANVRKFHRGEMTNKPATVLTVPSSHFEYIITMILPAALRKLGSITHPQIDLDNRYLTSVFHIHKLTPFSPGGRQKLQNATCYDLDIN